MNSPRLKKAFIFKFKAGLRVFAKLVSFLVKALADEFDRAATARLVAVDSEDLANEAKPAATDENRQRLIFVVFIHVVPVEEFARHVAPTAFHAADAFFECVQPRDITLTISFNLSRHLSATICFEF